MKVTLVLAHFPLLVERGLRLWLGLGLRVRVNVCIGYIRVKADIHVFFPTLNELIVGSSDVYIF